MLKSIAYILMLAGAAQLDISKKEMTTLQTAVDTAVVGTGARVMNESKATYLDGYGLVVVLEVSLEQPPNLFSSPKTPGQVRGVVAQRQKDVTEKLSDLLKERIKTVAIGATESMTVIVHLSNFTRADVPDLPAQLVMTVKKETPDQISVRPQ